MTEHENGIWIKNVECPFCSSSNNLSLYEKPDGIIDGFCQTPDCPDGQYKSTNKLAETFLAEEYDIKKLIKTNSNKKQEEKVITRTRRSKTKEKAPISKEQFKEIIDNSSLKGGGYRKIKDEWNKYYGVRTEFDGDGAVKCRYYPVTQGVNDSGKPKITAFKKRVCATKDFYPTGLLSMDSDLFGQWKCSSSKRVIICGGEEDTIAARQMIEEYRKRKGKDSIAPIDVVSSSLGEGSIDKQCQKQYDFLDGYDSIILNLDNDKAGDLAVEKLLKVLPYLKVRVMEQPEDCKDACDVLKNGLANDYIRNIYNAKKPVVAGITGSSTIFDGILENVSKKKVPLPNFLDKVNVMLEGGLSMNTFNIIAAHTSVGKSTVTNEILYHLVMNAEDKVGVISLEASKHVLGEQLLSLHLNKRIASITDEQEKVKFLLDNKGKSEELLRTVDGDDRFYIMDDRSYLSNPEEVFKNIDKLIRGFGVKLIIIDVLSDLMDNLDINAQAEFMGRIKKVIAANEVIIIGIMHMRKEMSGKEVNPHSVNEHSIYGSSTAIKSASTVILMSRDKLAECPEEKNTTRVTLTKNRGNGVTGKCCEIYYDYKTHKLHDKDDWLENNTEEY